MMAQNRTSKGRLRLDPASYRRVWERVLTRDGWRCQICGSSSNLQVHHIMRRSSLGNDEEENLITLCESCHRAAHRQ
jgi:5-methylcytosine-specific restriction endonuclease McrA